MKLVVCGDLHWRSTTPVQRVDDYPKTLEEKLIYVLDYAYKNDAQYLILPGDIFDSAKINNASIARLIQVLSSRPVKILGVMGQHDLMYRTTPNSPVQILQAAGVLKIMDESHYCIGDKYCWCVHGSSFGEEIPPAKKGVKNILVIHKMISDSDYWHGHVNYYDAGKFINDHPEYDIVISGDNHKRFVCEQGDQILFNMGSFGRQSIDQIEHYPAIVILDLNDIGGWDFQEIPIQPANDVFDFTKVEVEKKKNKKLEKFISELPKFVMTNELKNKIHFMRIVMDYLDDENIGQEVRNTVMECLESAQEDK